MSLSVLTGEPDIAAEAVETDVGSETVSAIRGRTRIQLGIPDYFDVDDEGVVVFTVEEGNIPSLRSFAAKVVSNNAGMTITLLSRADDKDAWESGHVYGTDLTREQVSTILHRMDSELVNWSA